MRRLPAVHPGLPVGFMSETETVTFTLGGQRRDPCEEGVSREVLLVLWWLHGTEQRRLLVDPCPELARSAR